ncbi:MAG: FAD-dependent oxidoreductase [Gemmatimonas sp.]|nr:FAD-dependent oxidoreductase [Gemmatimonas sp.]
MLSYDAVVVGAGPNGLAAAIELARAGLSVLVREAREEVGGAAKSLPLTLPGFIHDPFSSIYPLAVGSPYLSTLPLANHGLAWVQPPAPLAHPFDDGAATSLERSIATTAATLGRSGGSYADILEPLVRGWPGFATEILAPLHLPRSPILLARFGTQALRSASALARTLGGRAAALFAGSAAHSGLALDRPATAAIGLVLCAAGHAVGWPFPAGGAGRLSEAMASYLGSLGATIEVGAPVDRLDALPPSRAILLDLTPRQVVRIAGDRLPARYVDSLRRFRYGVGVFKLDWALSEPIPWRAPACRRAATIHLGGAADEIIAASRAAPNGTIAERPFVILAQHSLFDPTRTPPGMHTAWAYCHVPNGAPTDMTERIEAQVERFAPGFRNTILARNRLAPRDLEALDANLVGGDVNGGSPELRQIFFRPVRRMNPYSTPVEGLYLCSASTPPGGGVHGMCGYHAARTALRDLGIRRQ